MKKICEPKCILLFPQFLKKIVKKEKIMFLAEGSKSPICHHCAIIAESLAFYVFSWTFPCPVWQDLTSVRFQSSSLLCSMTSSFPVCTQLHKYFPSTWTSVWSFCLSHCIYSTEPSESRSIPPHHALLKYYHQKKKARHTQTKFYHSI